MSFKKIGGVQIVILVIVFGVLAYFGIDLWQGFFGGNNSNDVVACTADAKMCPDGSYVGRTGPNCEFVCPGESVELE